MFNIKISSLSGLGPNTYLYLQVQIQIRHICICIWKNLTARICICIWKNLMARICICICIWKNLTARICICICIWKNLACRICICIWKKSQICVFLFERGICKYTMNQYNNQNNLLDRNFLLQIGLHWQNINLKNFSFVKENI